MTIKELREATKTPEGKKMTQHEFAAYTGIPFRSIQNWEGGQRVPPDYIVKLLECYIKNTPVT